MTGCMHCVIPVNLVKVAEFSNGTVVIPKKKPAKKPTEGIPMRGTDWTATGDSIQTVLARDQQVCISLSKKVYLEAKKEPFCLSVPLSGDTELEDALKDLQLEPRENKTLHIRADFGDVVEIATDLVKSYRTGNVKVDINHAVVKRAIECGGALFVISTLYQAEHCKIAVRLGDQQDYTEGKQ